MVQVSLARPASPPPVFRAADGRFYEKVPVRVVEEPELRRVYTPQTAQTVLPAQSYPRRSASPRNVRPQYHRRTPSTNNDGTVMESIESPNIPQHHGSVDVRMRQHVDPDPRMYQSKPTLIDLTSSAEKASHRRPASPGAMQVTYQERLPNNVPVFGAPAPPQRRQLIELNDNVPVSRSVYRAEEVRRPATISYDQYATRPHAREYVDDIVYRHGNGHVHPSYEQPAERRVLHEVVVDRALPNQSIRYIANEPTPSMYNDRNTAAYRSNGHEQLYELPTQSYPAHEPSRRIIVLDTGDPMEDVQRTPNSRLVKFSNTPAWPQTFTIFTSPSILTFC